MFGKQYLSFIGILCSAVSQRDSKQRLKQIMVLIFLPEWEVWRQSGVGMLTPQWTLRPSPAKMQDEEVKLKAASLKLLHGSSMA